MVRQVAFDHDGKEFAVVAAQGDHAVLLAAVVKEAVPGLEDFHVLLDLELEDAFQDVVEFLAGVVGHFNGAGFQVPAVLGGDHEGLGQTVPEQVGQVVVLEAFPALDGHPFPGPGKGVAGQPGLFAGDQFGQVDAEALGAVVQESEPDVSQAVFDGQVFGDGGVRGSGHVLGGDAQFQPHVLEALQGGG